MCVSVKGNPPRIDIPRLPFYIRWYPSTSFAQSTVLVLPTIRTPLWNGSLEAQNLYSTAVRLR